MGSYCSVMNNTTGTMYCKYGANMTALEIAFAIIGDLADFIPGIGEEIAIIANIGENAVKIINLVDEYKMTQVKGNIDKWFKDHNYHSRSPNTEYKSGKLTLSLVVSAYCATVIDLGGGVLQLQVGTMTCWTGPKNGDVNRYKVMDCTWQTIETPTNNDINSADVQAVMNAMEQEFQQRISSITAPFLKDPFKAGTNVATNQNLIKMVNTRAATVGGTFDVTPGVAAHA